VIVLDAAALVDVVLDQRDADWILAQLAGEEVCAPAHQPAEVLSAVARLHRAGTLDKNTAQDALEEAMALRQELVVATTTHVLRALEINDRIRALDGLYVALAEERDCALITTDWRLAGAGAACEVRVPPQTEETNRA